MAKSLNLGLVGKIINNRFFRLQPAENVRPHDLAKWSVLVEGAFRQAFNEVRELLRRSKQARIDKVKDRPQIAKSVLDRRAGERKSRLRVQLFCGPGLLGTWVLDGLRFVQNN